MSSDSVASPVFFPIATSHARTNRANRRIVDARDDQVTAYLRQVRRRWQRIIRNRGAPAARNYVWRRGEIMRAGPNSRARAAG